jgi:hypothetical protein
MDIADLISTSADTTVRWLTGLPSTFWSVIVGALIALGGVELTTRRNRANLAVQHENDRQRKQEDVLLQTRRDVYLDAALVVEEAVGALFRLTDPQLSDNEATASFDSASAKMARIYVVAGANASAATASFMRAVSKAITELKFSRRRLLENRLVLARAEQARDRSFELLRAAFQSPLNGTETLEARQQLQQRREGEFNREQANVAAAIERGKYLQRDMFREAEQHHSKVVERMRPLLDAVRSELNATALPEAFYAAAGLDQKWSDAELNKWMNLPTASTPMPGTPNDQQ